MPQPTLLIVDNDEGLVTALSIRLEDAGYRCITANTGAQGLAAFKDNDIDLVITDLGMPAGNGVTLARDIRRQSEAPIVVLTGFRDEFKGELRGVANISIVRKPCEQRELLELIEAGLTLAGVPLPTQFEYQADQIAYES
ncbi:MAG: response regulator [Planctomycetota bacterium]